jgi:hypothetical protein
MELPPMPDQAAEMLDAMVEAVVTMMARRSPGRPMFYALSHLESALRAAAQEARVEAVGRTWIPVGECDGRQAFVEPPAAHARVELDQRVVLSVGQVRAGGGGESTPAARTRP